MAPFMYRVHSRVKLLLAAAFVLLAALELGATRAELVEYTDSGAASGDTDQVVGYAGLIID